MVGTAAEGQAGGPMQTRSFAEDGKAPPRRDAMALSGAFGRYRIEKTLGCGGMGAVYLAFDTQLERQVALKVALLSSPASRSRFLREAKATAALQHPNICPLLDSGELEGLQYLTMSFIDGKTLKDALRGKPLASNQAAKLTLKIALALAEAHARGIIHRDLKPANIMINRRGEPIVMDFGLAKMIEREQSLETKAGAIIGTPAYMSPEQVNGATGDCGAGADIFALGVILYELLTGQLPWSGNAHTMMYQILNKQLDPPSATNPSVDGSLDAICQKATAKRLEDRFGSMRAFADALKTYLVSSNSAAAGSGSAAAVERSGGRAKSLPAARLPPWRKLRLLLFGAIAVVLLAAILISQVRWGQSIDSADSRQARGPTLKQPAEVISASASAKPLLETKPAAVLPPEPPRPSALDDESTIQWNDNSLGLTFVVCGSGSFTMGSPPSENGYKEEEAQVDVTHTKRFWIAKYEVTQRQWKQVNKYSTLPEEKADEADHPVTYVSWHDAMSFCQKLTESERSLGRLPRGWSYSLPTEAQWEYACRAGSARAHYFGNQSADLDAHCWYRSNSAGRTHEVGLKPPNKIGLHDMYGNVWEWCKDSYSDKLPGGRDPERNDPEGRRIRRGGSWNSVNIYCRSALRSSSRPNMRNDSFGFRLALGRAE
jgi:formylglycine-generating enzyme required for sulfatase activity/predicted Ser/Thr protein kinase